VNFYGWDTETFLSQPGLAAPKVVCGSWADATTEHVALAPEAIRWFADRLRAGDHLAGVHISYDIVGPAVMEPDLLPEIFRAAEAGQFHDCALLEGLHDTALGGVRKKDTGELKRYSMEVLMQRLFGTDISAEKNDPIRFGYGALDGVPLDRWTVPQRDYPKRDARRSYDIRNRQRTHKNKHDEPAQVRGAIAIALMCAWGFRTDPEYLAHLELEVEGAWNMMREEFGRLGIYRPNGTRDTKTLQAIITKAYAGNPPKTPTGEVSTDRDTLLDSGDPLLEKLGNAGKNDKRKTVYLPALKKGIHVPINPNFNELVNTGRVSSDWQQLPQKGGLREAIVSRGHLERLQTGREPLHDTVLFSGDYGGLELRTMSQRAIYVVKYSRMAEFLNKKKDAHCHFGAIIKRISYDEFNAKGKTEFKSIRDVSKIGNFGFGGGAGGGAIAYNAKAKDNVRLGVSLGHETLAECGRERKPVRIGGKWKRVCAVCVETGDKLRELWLEAWPEQRELFAIANRLTSGRRLADVTIFGSNRVRGACTYTQWLNTPFQGAGGDGCKAAMWAIDRACYTNRRSPLWGSRIFLNVHDELCIELPVERQHEAAFEGCRIAVAEMDKVTPDVKNEMEPAIGRRLFKAATAVKDRQGMLKPWWPTDWKWAPDAEIMARDLAA
jgi:hypothetical protein